MCPALLLRCGTKNPQLRKMGLARHVALCAGHCAGSRSTTRLRTRLTFRAYDTRRPHASRRVILPAQVPCGVHTNTPTPIFSLTQPSAWEDKQQVKSEGDIDGASSRNVRCTSTYRTNTIAAGSPHTAQQAHGVPFASIVASMLPLACLARHAALHLAAPCCAVRAPLLHFVQDAARSQCPPGPPGRLRLR